MQEILISVDENGRLRIQHTCKDKITALGMLEMAKAGLLSDQASRPALAVAHGSLDGLNGLSR